MEESIRKLLEERVFFHFYQICRIPHGSGNEKALSDHILNWALELGLEARQDKWNNLFIRKDPTPGCENAPVVMLQAHLDMVCEQAEGCGHCFASDPIRWELKEGRLSTGGRTTLGADDGIGVALAMAVLEDNTLVHPGLEVLFTTMEEEDLSGAENFDTGAMRADYLINLDHVNEREILCGSCGGMQVDIRIPVCTEDIPEGWRSYRLSVSGLRGGHSGEDIHRGRGSANALLGRMLMAVEDCGPFLLGAARGGSFRLAIPRDAEAVVWLDPACLVGARAALMEIQALVRRELAETGESVVMALEPVQAPVWGVSPGTVMDAMALCPDGIHQMNEMLTGLVDTSDNLGEIYLDQDELHFILEIRAARDSSRTYLFQRMQRLANMLGGSCRWSNAYPSWEFRPVSALRRICGRVYQECYGRAPDFLTVHAGLEVGCLSAGRPELDAVAIGPDCWDFHSPGETLSVESTRRTYRYLCSVLAALSS